MKASIQNVKELWEKERTEDNEEDILAEFEMLIDWIQGHDGGLRRLD